MPDRLTEEMKNRTYWTLRNDEILRWLDEQDVDMFHRIENAYSEASRNVRKRIYEFYGEYAEDGEMTRREAERLLRGTDLSDYQENARRYREEAETMSEEDRERLLARLNQQYKASQATRLDSLQMDIMNELGRLNTGILQPLFTDYLFNITNYAYQNVIDPNFDTSTLNRPALEELVNRPLNGYDYSEDLWGNTDNLADKLFKTLREGFIRGSSVQDMARELRKDFNVGRANAETLVRTDGSHVVNSATLRRYRDTFGLNRVRIHVHVDDRTTETCMRFHEEDKSYPIDDAPILPAHYNCRSTYIPDEEELLEEHWLEAG